MWRLIFCPGYRFQREAVASCVHGQWLKSGHCCCSSLGESPFRQRMKTGSMFYCIDCSSSSETSEERNKEKLRGSALWGVSQTWTAAWFPTFQSKKHYRKRFPHSNTCQRHEGLSGLMTDLQKSEVVSFLTNLSRLPGFYCQTNYNVVGISSAQIQMFPCDVSYHRCSSLNTNYSMRVRGCFLISSPEAEYIYTPLIVWPVRLYFYSLSCIRGG